MPSARPLRILYHHRVAAADGMRVHIEAVVAALRAEGHEVLVVGPSDTSEAGRQSRHEALVDALRRRLPRAAFELLELAYNLPAYLRLRRAARAFRPDILYERYNLFLLAGLLLKRELRLPMLLEVNAPLFAERRQFGGLALRPLGQACERALWRGADVVLPVTEVLAQEVRHTRGQRSGVHVIPNGADLSARPAAGQARAARAALGIGPDEVVLGFVGFVRAWHGLGWAIEALPQLPEDVSLLVVGDGPACAELAQRAQALGVADRVRFTGRAPHAEVAALMANFDVALQTAATPYASPLKLFEYMALGRAVLAPDQPNIREVLGHERNALLFSPADRGSFVEALRRLCLEPDLRARLGEAARLTVETAPYTWRRNADRIARLARAELALRPRGASLDVAAAPAPARRS